MGIDKALYRVPNGNEPKPNNNVVPFPIKPGTESDWMKFASRKEVIELLMQYGNYGKKYLNSLDDKQLEIELKDLIRAIGA